MLILINKFSPFLFRQIIFFLKVFSSQSHAIFVNGTTSSEQPSAPLLASNSRTQCMVSHSNSVRKS